MRKVLSFVLVLSLVLGSLGMAFAAPMPDVKGEDFEDAVNVLVELGVVTGYPDGTYRPENIVTRAEMAVFVVNALGLADYAVGKSSFKDMAGHWSDAYVNYANALGVVSGYTDGTFRPDRTVSYDEAATMLVGALGYTPDSLVGTWPANYVSKAKTLGILDGIVAGVAGANRGDIATMVFQTLGLPIGKTDKNGKWEAFEIGVDKDPDTMLERLGAELYDGGNGAGKAFVLDSDAAEGAVANVREYLGAYVTAYQNSDGDIIAIKDVKSVFLKGDFKAGGKFKADGVEYTVDAGALLNNHYAYNATDTAIQVDNGVTDATSKAAVATGEFTLAAKVSGKKITAVYSLGKWVPDAAELFEDGDLDDDSLMNIDFKKDDNEDIDFNNFALLGADSLDAIEEDNVVYVYEGGGFITRIEVGTEVVEGEVTKLSGSKYTINGTAYEVVSRAGVTADAAALAVKNEVRVWLDYDGKIFSSELLKGEKDQLAVVLEHNTSGSSGKFGDAAEIYLFLADGTDAIFEADAKEINDVAFITTAGGTFTWNVTLGSIVKYSLDSKGVIDGMELAKVTSVTSPVATFAEYDVTASGYMDGYKIAADAVIFTVEDADATSAKAKDYGVKTAQSLNGAKDVFADYSLNDKNQIDLIVMEAATTGDEEVFGVYEGTRAKISADPGNEVVMFVDGKSVTYKSNNGTYDKVKVADGLYLITFDNDGNVKDVSTTLGKAGDFGILYVTPGSATATDVSIKIVNNVAEITLTGAGVVTTAGGVGTLYDGIAGGQTAKVSLASDVVVYKLDGTKWKVGSKSDLTIKDKNVEVFFYDVYGKDKVADIVLIK